jgi:hypothetical protein
MQTWVALPREHEETAPSFRHHASSSLPLIERPDARLRIIAGRAWGEESPVRALGEILNVAIDLAAEGEVTIDALHAERALYLLEGDAQLDGADAPMRHLLVLEPGRPARLRAKTPLKAMLFGGAPLDGPRHLWWNFVSSSKERIEQAKQDWRDGRFGTVPGDNEHIPLPET